MPRTLFIYGTLHPDLAPPGIWSVVRTLRAVEPATVAGALFDLGAYPGLLLDDGPRTVQGTLFELPDDPSVLRQLDRYEGFDPQSPEGSLFLRVKCRVTLASGGPVDAWVYVYNGSVTGQRRIESGRWPPGGEEGGRA
jgi:gamma-glutamylcyclotransferase (GGCT)/AIG2-like uncharacterized protein YtfP